MIFYKENLDNVLRFGDVVRGYISASPTIGQPMLKVHSETFIFKVDFEVPSYSVVLTPCCSIGESTISLTPLIKLRKDFFKNPYFVEDFTRINREMSPENAQPPEEWGKLTSEEKSEKIADGLNYALLEFFVYEKNEFFSEYQIRGRSIRYYMIDLRDVYRVKCAMIKRPEQMKPVDSPIIESKVLQLSVRARAELRDKVSYYYSRTPKEDMLLED